MSARTVRVFGVALGGAGYPNAQQTIQVLRAVPDWTILDEASWLAEDVRLWRLAERSRLGGAGLRLAMQSFMQAFRAMLKTHPDELVYVPYPAPLTMWWLSFVPTRWRPRLVADAYISIWDSMFRDRRAMQIRNWMSRMVKGFEGRSLRAAHLVLVDTEANRKQMICDFGLNPECVISLPLAIDARRFVSLPERSNEAGRCRVLFVGTMIPLHGIECVLRAIELLVHDQRFEFRFIGDGQQAYLVEEFLQRVQPHNATWLRQWCGLEQLAEEFAVADVCLGVFGGESKAARVLPFKVYYALAAGKAIISQSQVSLPAGVPLPPLVSVAGDAIETRARALAEALAQLAADAELRMRLGQQAAQYYATHLSSKAIAVRWHQIASRA